MIASLGCLLLSLYQRVFGKEQQQIPSPTAPTEITLDETDNDMPFLKLIRDNLRYAR